MNPRAAAILRSAASPAPRRRFALTVRDMHVVPPEHLVRTAPQCGDPAFRTAHREEARIGRPVRCYCHTHPHQATKLPSQPSTTSPRIGSPNMRKAVFPGSQCAHSVRQARQTPRGDGTRETVKVTEIRNKAARSTTARSRIREKGQSVRWRRRAWRRRPGRYWIRRGPSARPLGVADFLLVDPLRSRPRLNMTVRKELPSSVGDPGFRAAHMIRTNGRTRGSMKSRDVDDEAPAKPLTECDFNASGCTDSHAS